MSEISIFKCKRCFKEWDDYEDLRKYRLKNCSICHKEICKTCFNKNKQQCFECYLKLKNRHNNIFNICFCFTLFIICWHRQLIKWFILFCIGFYMSSKYNRKIEYNHINNCYLKSTVMSNYQTLHKYLPPDIIDIIIEYQCRGKMNHRKNSNKELLHSMKYI